MFFPARPRLDRIGMQMSWQIQFGRTNELYTMSPVGTNLSLLKYGTCCRPCRVHRGASREA
ncbi:hypothetical protein MESS2_730252 [Mesorhizobium metallidurans STM 2683]|uniref:Uncharacterized protein n=1 Tax=Mesorhizobium metallidurans STM 2683 TaxID=1297569 RepID=M5F8Z9_9HYPH|nr:hypothetical protein MESS2_730252 [Mesorhizobium metallidurans STM 2683]